MKNDPNQSEDVTNIDFNKMFKTSQDDAGQSVTVVTGQEPEGVTKTNDESLCKTTAYDKCNTVTVVTRNLTNMSRKTRVEFGNKELPRDLKNGDLIHGISISTLREKASTDWPELLNDRPSLDMFAKLIFEEEQRKKGIVPDGWTKIVNCSYCGFVYLWEGCPAKVVGCPWCHVKAVGITIPRP